MALVIPFALAISVYISSEFGHDPVLFLFPFQVLVWAGLLLPGALLYAWILENLSPRLSRFSRRAYAIGLTPVVPAVAYFVVLDGFGDYVWGFLVPTVLVYGAVVRLPSRVDTPGAETSEASKAS